MDLISLGGVLVLVAAHLWGQAIYRRNWLERDRLHSIGGGLAAAFVFMEMLPLLHQWEGRTDHLHLAELTASHLHLLALMGLVGFYGLEWLMLRERYPERRNPAIFMSHLGVFALYNLLIGYFLVHEIEAETTTIVFTIALAAHMIVNDHALRKHHEQRYDRLGRWLLALAPMGGWLLASLVALPESVVTVFFALLAGSIVVNVLKDELPRERPGDFGAFAIAAASYTLILMAV